MLDAFPRALKEMENTRSRCVWRRGGGPRWRVGAADVKTRKHARVIRLSFSLSLSRFNSERVILERRASARSGCNSPDYSSATAHRKQNASPTSLACVFLRCRSERRRREVWTRVVWDRRSSVHAGRQHRHGDGAERKREHRMGRVNRVLGLLEARDHDGVANVTAELVELRGVRVNIAVNACHHEVFRQISTEPDGALVVVVVTGVCAHAASAHWRRHVVERHR